jgi:fluoroquinolone transport system permease protein
MRGTLTLLRWDVVMQFRYGFWLSGLAITVTWVLLLRALSPAYLAIWLPCVLYFDIGILGLMFIAGVLFFEKRQGVLDALVVTPLRTEAWLASKVLSLTLLATTVAGVMVLATVGLRADWFRVLPFFALVAALFTLGGLLMASRFPSVGSFLAAFGLVGVPLALPLVDYFEIWTHPLLWLNPAHPGLVLIRHAFRPGSAVELGAALLLTVFWIVLGFRMGLKAFHRRVSWRRGAA